MQEYIIPIISAAVSVSSIFVSNWLGMKNQLTDRKIETDNEIYYSLLAKHSLLKATTG